MTKTKFAFEYADVPTGSDPVSHRRSRLVERLNEQAALATDPTKNIRVMVRNKKGSGPVEIKQIIRPTFRNSSGKVLFWAKVGSGKLELAPGKFAVVVESTKVIPQMVEALVERVNAGEFDTQLAAKKKTAKAKPLNTPVKLAGKKKAA